MGNLPINLSPDTFLSILKNLAALAMGAAQSHGLAL